MGADQGLNRLTMDAVVAECSELRYTPAGIPVLELLLDHRSEQVEAGRPRRVECALRAKALGAMATALCALPAGARIRCSGFLARRARVGTSVQLHVQEFEWLRGD